MWHPITIPRSQVDYKNLESENLAVEDLKIICPNGQAMSGRMCHGVAGYGPYYQIKINGPGNDNLCRLNHGQRLIIEIEKVGKEVQVRINEA
jgi:hypothetical protein